jgi:hypothetical protein
MEQRIAPNPPTPALTPETAMSYNSGKEASVVSARGERLRRRAAAGAAWAARGAAAAAFLLVCVMLVRSALRAHEQNAALWARAEAFAVESRRLEEKRARLSAECFALEHDPYYLERLLREEWRRRRDGDVILERTGAGSNPPD